MTDDDTGPYIDPETGKPITGMLFTAREFGEIEFLLQAKMTEARANRLFKHIARGIHESDDPVDIAWALAQMLDNLIRQADPDPETQTMLFRGFMTMVLMVGKRRDRARPVHNSVDRSHA